MAVLLGALALSLSLQAKSYYPCTMTVTRVDYTTDVVTITTYGGDDFQFEGCEDWFVGDICSTIMFDNGTESIYDDEIVSVRYCGY